MVQAQRPRGDGDERASGEPGEADGVGRVSQRVMRAIASVERSPRLAKLMSDARDASLHRLTTLMIFAAGFVLFGVPHIRALLAPPTSPVDLAVYAFSVLCAVPLYVVMWFATLPVELIDASDGPSLGRSDSWYVRLHRRFQWAGRPIDELLAHVRRSRATAVLLLVVALSLLLVRSTPVIVNLVALGGWLLVRSFGLPWALGDERSRAAASQVIGRTVTMLLLANLAVELVWWLQSLRGHYEGTYSIWAVFQTLFAITLVVRTVDVLGLLGVLGSSEWRFAWALVVVVAFAVFPSGTRVGDLRPDVAAGGAASLGAALAPTGTAHAAPQPAQPWLEAMESRLGELPAGQPVILVAASGGGSRAAITASLVFELLDRTPRPELGAGPGTLADNVLLVSSVSGGSLATAYFYTHEPALTQGPPGQSLFVRAMGRDYMAPLLRGVLNVAQERGAAVASFWRETYGWHRVFDDQPRSENRPLVVLNGTHVQEGTRVAFGFPALPVGLLERGRVAADIGPRHRLNLADAVRISANFPYGFDHVRYGDGPHELIDGGVVDNTGLDTLVSILAGLQPLAARTGGDEGPAGRVLAELQRRGVVVLEIDAGARPAKPSVFARIFPSLSKPIEALGRSGHLNSTILRERNLERFDELVSPAHVGLVRAGPNCDPDGDVMTAWALDSRDRERIVRDFARVQSLVIEQLALQVEAIARLQGLEGGADGEGAASRYGRRLQGYHREMQALARERASAHHLCAGPVDVQLDARLHDVGERLRKGFAPAESEPSELVTGVAGDAPAGAEGEGEGESGNAGLATREAPAREPPRRAPRRPKAGGGSTSASGSASAGDPLAGLTRAPALKKGAASSPSLVEATAAKKAPPPVDDPFSKQRMAQLADATRSKQVASLADAAAALERKGIKLGIKAPRALGWVYLGTREGERWETRYADWRGAGVPRPGASIRLSGTSHVRTAMPDERGAMAPSRMTLPPKTELVVLETRDWGEVGFIWARVAAAR